MLTSRVLWIVTASSVAAIVAIAASSVVSFGQSPESTSDPDLEPAPTVFASDAAQSIVLLVEFNSATDVELVSGTISKSPPPGRTGGPPLIGVEVMDVAGGVIEAYNAWHPLWVETELEDGSRGIDIAPSGEGRFIFPFAPDVGIVRITDIELDLELIEIDARQIVLDYCAVSPSDPSCASVPGPGQLPGTGGTPTDVSSSSLLWVAAIAGALALASVSGAVWATRNRLRSR